MIMGIKLPAYPRPGDSSLLPRVKLQTARQTLERADGVWSGFVRRSSGTLRLARDIDRHAIAVEVSLDGAAPLQELTMLVRSCVHDCRSALDNLIAGLAREQGVSGRQLRQVAFLVAETEVLWDRDVKRRLAGLPNEVVARARSLQPFSTLVEVPGPVHPLLMLHQLWNADKHQDGYECMLSLSPQAGVTRPLTLAIRNLDPRRADELMREFDVDRDMDVVMAPIVDGTRLWEFRVPTRVRLDDVDAQPQPAQFTLGLNGPGVSVSDPVVAVLRNAHRFVEEAVSYILGESTQVPEAFPPGVIDRPTLEQE